MVQNWSGRSPRTVTLMFLTHLTTLTRQPMRAKTEPNLYIDPDNLVRELVEPTVLWFYLPRRDRRLFLNPT
ncbi:hypothetical protein TNCV_2099701 [Trichonephila clavipes]|nr:hypothetical protein TNCV_2099701 [Trichonephila clavipes]